jgi:hypothetical protein
MKTALALLFVASLLLLGCTGGAEQPPAQQPPSQPVQNASQNATTQPPPPQPPAMTCRQYCGTKPLPACNGEWNATGTYPDCTCDYVCYVPTPRNDTNLTTPEEPILPYPIDETVAEMLDSGMKKLQSEFYRTNSGSFIEKSYTWARIPVDTDLNDISFGASPGGDVKFDNKTSADIVASGFTVFEDSESHHRTTYGLAIFKAKRTLLDDIPPASMFSIDYFPPDIDKELRDCVSYGKDYYSTPGGDWFVSYSFICWKTYDK